MPPIHPAFCAFALLTLAPGAAPILAATIDVADYGAHPDDGTDDTAAINDAITAATSGDVVTLAAGTYDLIDEYDSNRFIKISSKNGITLQGATSGGVPTTKLLRHVVVENMASPPRTIYGYNSSDITIENFVVDNSPELATSGEITAIDPSGTYVKVRIFSGLPMEAGTACYSANVWDPATLDLKHVPSLTQTSSPGNWTIDDAANRIMKLSSAGGLAFIGNVAAGEYMSWHYGWNGQSQMEFSKVDGLVMANLIVRNAINMAILIGQCSDITLTGITMRPEGNQLPVGPRDGIHISRSTGTIVCSNLDITGVRLDGFVVRSPYAEITAVTSTTEFRIGTELATYGQPIAAGTSLSLISPTGNLYSRVVSSASYVSQTGSTSYYDIVTATALPGFAGVGTAMKVGGLGPDSVSLTDSNFENIGGSAMILFTDDITVDDVDCRNIMYPAIHMGSNPTAGVCGSNITVENSLFESCGWVTKNGHYGMITIANDHDTYTEDLLRNVTLQDNLFMNQLFAGTNPAINIFDTDTLTLSGNYFENVYRGFTVDAGTVSNATLGGTEVVIDNDDNTATYAELAGSFANSTLTGYNGSKTRFAGAGAKASWTFIAPNSGTYRVYLYKVQYSSSDSNAKISVTNDGTTSVSYVDCSAGTSGWIDLGAFGFTAGTSYYVTNERSNGYLRSDAVRFVQE